jgi:hypothetical protein
LLANVSVKADIICNHMVCILCNKVHNSFDILLLAEARGSVVVKALGYKPEGRGFDTR